jgi:hypothetical protein
VRSENVVRAPESPSADEDWGEEGGGQEGNLVSTLYVRVSIESLYLTGRAGRWGSHWRSVGVPLLLLLLLWALSMLAMACKLNCDDFDCERAWDFEDAWDCASGWGYDAIEETVLSACKRYVAIRIWSLSDMESSADGRGSHNRSSGSVLDFGFGTENSGA